MPTDITPVLAVNGISKKLGGRKILKDISFCVFPGEIFGFLGRNGSGKTTTIKMILGLLGIDKGSISICGFDVGTEFEKAAAGVGGIVENPEMYRYLSGRENLQLYANMYGNIPQSRIGEVAGTVGLEDRIDDKVATYSLGMKQRLGLAQAILHRPRLLVLDEPTNGLDPAGIRDLRDILKRISQKDGVAVFISSHQLAELDLICDRIGILDGGVLLKTMTIAEVRSAGGSESVLTLVIDPATAPMVPKFLERLKTEDPSVLHGSVEHEEIPDTIYALSDAGVRIYSAEPAKSSIEDVFLALTEHREAAAGDEKPADQPEPGGTPAGPGPGEEADGQ